MANVIIEILDFFSDMSSDVPAFKVRAFASVYEFWIGVNE